MGSIFSPLLCICEQVECNNDSSDENEEDDDPKTKHSRHLGSRVPLGLMQDVLVQFYVKKSLPPTLVPLCQLVPHKAVRFSLDLASWLIPSFDNAAYLETMGIFLVSLARPS